MAQRNLTQVRKWAASAAFVAAAGQILCCSNVVLDHIKEGVEREHRLAREIAVCCLYDQSVNWY